MATQLTRMHKHYGKDHLHRCGKCCNFSGIKFERSGNGQIRPKCRRYDITNDSSSDWKMDWTACGAFDQPMTRAFREIHELCVEHKAEDKMSGQMDLFG